MEEKSRLAQILDSVSEWLNEQTWFQQLKAKWEELDPQSRLYLQISGAVGALGLLVIVLGSFYWNVHKTRSELMAKSELLSNLTAASDELKALQTTNSAASGATAAAVEPWQTYFETAAGNSGIGKTNLTVSESKPGATSDVSKEALYDLTLKKVSIRQAVRFAQGLETGTRPVKLRNLTIDTQPDMSGYLDATLSVSAFALVEKK